MANIKKKLHRDWSFCLYFRIQSASRVVKRKRTSTCVWCWIFLECGYATVPRGCGKGAKRWSDHSSWLPKDLSCYLKSKLLALWWQMESFASIAGKKCKIQRGILTMSKLIGLCSFLILPPNGIFKRNYAQVLNLYTEQILVPLWKM